MFSAPEILVPVDFSPCSVNALRVAIEMASPEGDLTLLHAIDQEFIDDAAAAGLGTAEEITLHLRTQAEASFATMLEGIDAGSVDIDRMTVIGVPFIEILKIARDLDLPMIVMGVKGRWAVPEGVLFGSTAEKVLRGARVPVLAIPYWPTERVVFGDSPRPELPDLPKEGEVFGDSPRRDVPDLTDLEIMD